MTPELATLDLLILGMCAIATGMFFLVKGGDWLVDSAVYIAFHKGVSPLVVGFTIIAFGTSLPELLASMTAIMKGSPGIAIGNVLGSNVANILLVAGSSALIIPLVIHRHLLIKDTVFMLACTAVLAGLMLGEAIERWEGLGLFITLLVYAYWKYKESKKGKTIVEEVQAPEIKNMRYALFYLFLGLIAISGGADFLIRGSTLTARLLGVPELIIGLSVVALGTSLPELAACVAAAKKKQTDVIIGNIIGSNIFNILMIIGLCAFTKPFIMGDIAARATSLDIWVTVAVTVLFSFLILSFKKMGWKVGIVFVLFYIAYIVFQYQSVLVNGGA